MFNNPHNPPHHSLPIDHLATPSSTASRTFLLPLIFSVFLRTLSSPVKTPSHAPPTLTSLPVMMLCTGFFPGEFELSSLVFVIFCFFFVFSWSCLVYWGIRPIFVGGLRLAFWSVGGLDWLCFCIFFLPFQELSLWFRGFFGFLLRLRCLYQPPPGVE